MESKVTSKGQITIPKAIREELGLKPGARVKFFMHPHGGAVILPELPVTALRGIATRLGKRTSRPVSLEEMEAAIAAGAVAGAGLSGGLPPRRGQR